jgi:diadenosine tetraphosphate (Ap4A) HIT family hydrolase
MFDSRPASKEVAVFVLHPKLEADTIFVADWWVSRVLLMNDARYRWLVLVPRRAGMSELFDLSEEDRTALIEEIAHGSRLLKQITGAAKINVGALGNLVPQLHVHIVARNLDDPAWPGPVWGHSPAVSYEIAARDGFIRQFLKTR